MKTITTETIICIGEPLTTFCQQQIIVRVEDEAAGPYLVIRGLDDEEETEEKKYSFYLQSEKEIDEFAAICKRILKDAEE